MKMSKVTHLLLAESKLEGKFPSGKQVAASASVDRLMRSLRSREGYSSDGSKSSQASSKVCRMPLSPCAAAQSICKRWFPLHL